MDLQIQCTLGLTTPTKKLKRFRKGKQGTRATIFHSGKNKNRIVDILESNGERKTHITRESVRFQYIA